MYLIDTPALYKVYADNMRVAAAPRIRVEISADTPFGPIWANIWPKCQFLVIDLNVKKKLPYA